VLAPVRLYRRLPTEVRRCLRPLNLVDEAASLCPRLRTPVTRTTEAVRRLVRLARTRYPVRRLEGAGRPEGAPLACVLATDDVSARYWSQTLFEGPPAERRVGEVRALAAVRAAAETRDADLAFWQAPWPVAMLARRSVRVPSWVPIWLATDRSLEEVVTGDRRGRAARKNDVRRVQRLGLTVRVTHDRDAFEAFRRRLYEPYVRGRFGALVVPQPPHAFRHARRNGWLVLAEHEGRPVAGVVLERWGRDVRVLVFGADLSGTIPPHAAIEAAYYYAIRFAIERGFRRLGFGTCRPVLTDGVLRYKRKWGGRLGAPDTWDRWLLRYRNTPALRAALTAAPLVIERGRGRLAALAGAHGAAGDDLRHRVRQLEIPGLEELACLVGETAQVQTAADAETVPLRLVAPGEVWPEEAATT